MKKVFFFSVLVLMAVVAFAAGNKEQAGLPDYVVNPPMAEDAIYGVGYAKMDQMNRSIQIAVTRARADIAKQLSVQVQSAMTDYFQKAGIAENAQTIEFVENITREITNTKLNKTTVVNRNPMDDGGVWVLVKYTFGQATTALEETANNFVRSEEAAFSEFKADEAAAMLDSLLKENPTTSEPVEN